MSSRKRTDPKRLLVYRGAPYSINYLSGISGKSANVIIGWDRRGILEYMLDQVFNKMSRAASGH